MRIESLLREAARHDGMVARGHFTGAPARLFIPARPKLSLPELFLPEPLLQALRSGVDDDGLDPELLRRILREQLGAMAPAGEAWSQLRRELAETGLLRDALPLRRPRPRLVGPAGPALILPSRAPVQWSLPQPQPLPNRLVRAAERPARDLPLDLSALALALEPVSTCASGPATPTDYSSLVLPAIAAALEPREPMAQTRPPRVSVRPARRPGKAWAGRRLGLLAGGLAAAVAAALVLPVRTSEHRAPASAVANGTAAEPGAIRSANALSPLAVVPAAAPMATRTATSTQVPPEAPSVVAPSTAAQSVAAPSVAAPSVTASVERQPTIPPKPAASHIAPPSPVQPAQVVLARTEAVPVTPQAAAQTTIVPRDVAGPSRRRTAQKKKPAVAAASRKRPDVATLVLPDVLKPH